MLLDFLALTAKKSFPTELKLSHVLSFPLSSVEPEGRRKKEKWLEDGLTSLTQARLRLYVFADPVVRP